MYIEYNLKEKDVNYLNIIREWRGVLNLNTRHICHIFHQENVSLDGLRTYYVNVECGTAFGTIFATKNRDKSLEVYEAILDIIKRTSPNIGEITIKNTGYIKEIYVPE